MILTDQDYGYSIYLPDNWIRVTTADAHHFYDTTFVHRSQISIHRLPRDTQVYTSTEEWSRAHYIAQILTVESYATFPYYGAILFSDSSQSAKIGDLWAPEILTMYFSSSDTINSFSEYLVYTSSNDYGYEIYALGDTADMNANVALYAAIIKCMTLPANTRVIAYDRIRFAGTGPEIELPVRCIYNPAGRRLQLDMELAGPRSGLFLIKKKAVYPFQR